MLGQRLLFTVRYKTNRICNFRRHMAKPESTSLIYFTSLELDSVRCFGRPQRLDLTDATGNPAQWTLLLGDNGVGKTTLLQCLSWMRPVPAEIGRASCRE